MDAHDFAVWVCGAALPAAAAWIWLRDDAHFYEKADRIFILSVSILWIGMVAEFYGPSRFPARLLEPPDEQTAAPEEAARGPTGRYGRWTAVYDIAAHTVYLPNGKRLEAHSGLGDMRDDPRFVSQRNHGATPPNVYELSLLGQLFYGVRALRLTPIGDSPGFGRDGFLAHTYMLGRGGDSHGCIVFQDYNSFLQAFLQGEIKRVVVVAHLD